MKTMNLFGGFTDIMKKANCCVRTLIDRRK